MCGINAFETQGHWNWKTNNSHLLRSTLGEITQRIIEFWHMLSEINFKGGPYTVYVYVVNIIFGLCEP